MAGTAWPSRLQPSVGGKAGWQYRPDHRLPQDYDRLGPLLRASGGLVAYKGLLAAEGPRSQGRRQDQLRDPQSPAHHKGPEQLQPPRSAAAKPWSQRLLARPPWEVRGQGRNRWGQWDAWGKHLSGHLLHCRGRRTRVSGWDRGPPR